MSVCFEPVHFLRGLGAHIGTPIPSTSSYCVTISHPLLSTSQMAPRTPTGTPGPPSTTNLLRHTLPSCLKLESIMTLLPVALLQAIPKPNTMVIDPCQATHPLRLVHHSKIVYCRPESPFGAVTASANLNLPVPTSNDPAVHAASNAPSSGPACLTSNTPQYGMRPLAQSTFKAPENTKAISDNLKCALDKAKQAQDLFNHALKRELLRLAAFLEKMSHQSEEEGWLRLWLVGQQRAPSIRSQRWKSILP